MTNTRTRVTAIEIQRVRKLTYRGLIKNNYKSYKLVIYFIIVMHVFRHIPTLATMKMRAADKEIKSSLRVMIEKREKAMKNGESCNEDLLGILVESNQMEIQGNGNNKSVGITIEEVITECKLFYIAGQETTSSLLVWTLIMLSKYPEWQARAREEVLHVFGKQNPKFDGLSLLKTVCITCFHLIVFIIYSKYIFMITCAQMFLT